MQDPQEEHDFVGSRSIDLPLEINRVQTLNQPKLGQVIDIENESFPSCERLGPHLMAQQASLRTSGLLLAELGASIGGFLLFSRTGASGLITKLAVSPAFRRRGIGSALMRRGIEELERPTRTSFLHDIQLHVDPGRPEARALYESFGFTQQALLRDYYSDQRDALLMRRLCAPPTEPPTAPVDTTLVASVLAAEAVKSLRLPLKRPTESN